MFDPLRFEAEVDAANALLETMIRSNFEFYEEAGQEEDQVYDAAEMIVGLVSTIELYIDGSNTPQEQALKDWADRVYKELKR